MSRLMARGMSMLNRNLAIAAAPVTAITCRMTAAGSLVSLPNWIHAGGRQADEGNIGDYNARIGHNEADFTGPLSDLIAGGITEPAIGMRFYETLNGTAYVFECIKIPNGREWDWCDPMTKTRVRVHTKRQEV